jgi:hypothetical protein
MKTFATILVFMTFLSNSFAATEPNAVNEIEHALEIWQLKTPLELRNLTDRETAPSARILLGKAFMEQIPDSTRLMSSLVEYMVKGTQGAPSIVKMVWKSISNPQERARFLAAEAGRTGPESMGYVSTLIKHELVDTETERKHPEAWDAIGLGREILYTGSAFAPLMQSPEGANIYVAAVWFHEAPYLAARACVVGDDVALRNLELVNNLRLELDDAKTEEARLGIWRKLDKELVQLMRSGLPAFQAFGAGVLKSRRRNVASLGDSPELKDAIAKANTPLVICILEGATKNSLLALSGSQRVVLRVSAPTQRRSAEASPSGGEEMFVSHATANQLEVKAKAMLDELRPNSWLVWLLVVIAATVGAVWVFLRKSK